MFSEIMKVIPKMDSKDIAALQKQLQSRFTKIAKNFGQGITNVLKGGGIAGVALALIDKVLNPLKEVQESIDRMLQSSDDIATNAKQFNTTTGRLFKIIQLAKASGLDQDNLFTLINKFQGAVAQAKADPKDQSVNSVKNFVGRDDTAAAFFEFIQSLQRMEKGQQVLVQSQVFGEKQILKMADFLQQDFGKLVKDTGLDKISSEKFTKSIEGMAALNDLNDVLKVSRENKDVLKKGDTINESMIRARDKAEQVSLEKENQRIKSYHDLATITATMDKMMIVVEKGVIQLGSVITTLTPKIDKLIATADGIMKSPMLRLFGKRKGD
jgi:hypothetical protein